MIVPKYFWLPRSFKSATTATGSVALMIEPNSREIYTLVWKWNQCEFVESSCLNMQLYPKISNFSNLRDYEGKYRRQNRWNHQSWSCEECHVTKRSERDSYWKSAISFNLRLVALTSRTHECRWRRQIQRSRREGKCGEKLPGRYRWLNTDPLPKTRRRFVLVSIVC